MPSAVGRKRGPRVSQRPDLPIKDPRWPETGTEATVTSHTRARGGSGAALQRDKDTKAAGEKQRLAAMAGGVAGGCGVLRVLDKATSSLGMGRDVRPTSD